MKQDSEMLIPKTTIKEAFLFNEEITQLKRTETKQPFHFCSCNIINDIQKNRQMEQMTSCVPAHLWYIT